MDRDEIADRLVSVFFPQRCLLCNEVVAYDDFWCDKCAKTDQTYLVKRGRVECDFPCSFADALAATHYSSGARELILRMKRKADKRVLRFFADEICELMSEHWNGIMFDTAVPVPTTESRMKGRGFNPAELLAKSVGKRIGIPICNDALIRKEGTRPQRGLTAAERRENAENSYMAGKSGNLMCKRILLVDDVFTTGSTADTCSRLLMEAGADSVYVVTASCPRRDNSVDNACNHSKTVL